MVKDTEFTDKVLVRFTVPENLFQNLNEKIIDGLCGRAEALIVEQIWAEISEI